MSNKPECVLVDDFIDNITPTEPESVRYAKFVLNIKRFPAVVQMAFRPFIKNHLLFAKHNGVWHRVNVASRMGDIGICSDLTTENGYKIRVDISEITEWSNRPNQPYLSAAIEEMLDITKDSVSGS